MRNRLSIKANVLTLSLLFTVVSLFTLSACGGEAIVYYHTYRAVPKTGWLPTDTLLFETDIADSTVCLDLYIDVRHQSDYSYDRLPLLLTCIGTDSTALFTDTLMLMLADSTGRWLGKGMSGLYQYSKEVRQLRPDKAGRYGFHIRHTVGNDTIRAISDVGIKLQSSLPPRIQSQENE